MSDLLRELPAIVEKLGELGESAMGDLSRAQACLFHNATQMLADLEEDLLDEEEKLLRSGMPEDSGSR